MDYSKLALELHEKYKRSKNYISLRIKRACHDKLSAYCSPGVGTVVNDCRKSADLPVRGQTI